VGLDKETMTISTIVLEEPYEISGWSFAGVTGRVLFSEEEMPSEKQGDYSK